MTILLTCKGSGKSFANFITFLYAVSTKFSRSTTVIFLSELKLLISLLTKKTLTNYLNTPVEQSGQKKTC